MKKHAKLLIIIFIMAIAVSLFAIQMRADLGGYSGSSDYGGGDWGGSSSDWGSSDYSSSGGSIIPGGFGFDSIIVVVIIIIIVLVVMKKAGKGGGRPVAPGAQGVNRSTLNPMSKYAEIDPGFSEDEFREKLSNLYVQMQDCCQNKDMEPLRPYLTDALYSQFDRQLDGLRNNNQTNMVERISVLGVDLMGFLQDETNDTVYVRMNTRIIDYIIDDATGNVISGSKTAEKFMVYEWSLIRAKGVTSASASEEKTVNCPNCGAPMNVNHSAKCEYCGSIITTDAYDWVLSSVKGISQRTA